MKKTVHHEVIHDLMLAAENENLPSERLGSVVVIRFRQFDDMAMPIGITGIGRIDLFSSALGVIGHDAIHFAVHQVGLDVLWAVHPGGAQQVSGAARIACLIGTTSRANLPSR